MGRQKRKNTKKNKTKKTEIANQPNHNSAPLRPADKVKLLTKRFQKDTADHQSVVNEWKQMISADGIGGDDFAQHGGKDGVKQRLFSLQQYDALKALSNYQRAVLHRWLIDYDEKANPMVIACALGNLHVVKRMMKYKNEYYAEGVDPLDFTASPLNLSPLLLTVAFADYPDVQKLKVSAMEKMAFEPEPDSWGLAKWLLANGAKPTATDYCGNTICHLICDETEISSDALEFMDDCILASRVSEFFGREVVLDNLSSTRYNGQKGILVGFQRDEKAEFGRNFVMLDDGKSAVFQPKNIFVEEMDGSLTCILNNYNLADETDRLESTCLHKLVVSENYDALKRLLTLHNARVDIKDYNGMTVHERVTSKGYNKDSLMAKMIIKHAEEMENKRKKTCAQCGKIPDLSWVCNKCRNICYCDATCQRKHWEHHKKYCTDDTDTVMVLPPTKAISHFPDGYEADQLRWMTMRNTVDYCRIIDLPHVDIYLKCGSPGFAHLVSQAMSKVKVGKPSRVKVSFDVRGICTIHSDTVAKVL